MSSKNKNSMAFFIVLLVLGILNFNRLLKVVGAQFSFSIVPAKIFFVFKKVRVGLADVI